MVHSFTLAMMDKTVPTAPFPSKAHKQSMSIFSPDQWSKSTPIANSYIAELKYAKYPDPNSRVDELRCEAISQARRYADTEIVHRAVGSTIPHKIIVIYKGMDIPVRGDRIKGSIESELHLKIEHLFHG